MDKKERYLGYMLYRAQLSEKVAITESRESTLGNHFSKKNSLLFLSLFCTIFFVSHISYAFTTKVYKFHDF